jgi:glutamate racemase
MKIGIMDWGIGGVGLLKEIRGNSDADIIYLSDTGFTPYGKVSSEDLEKRINILLEFLSFSGCETIAVACNAASTILPKEKNIIGIIDPAIELVIEMNLKSIGVFGGKRTIES